MNAGWVCPSCERNCRSVYRFYPPVHASTAMAVTKGNCAASTLEPSYVGVEADWSSLRTRLSGAQITSRSPSLARSWSASRTASLPRAWLSARLVRSSSERCCTLAPACQDCMSLREDFGPSQAAHHKLSPGLV
jgi:hypothetical protein